MLQQPCISQGPKGVWRNGSASDSRSEGWEFESLCPHLCKVASFRIRFLGQMAVTFECGPAPRLLGPGTFQALHAQRLLFCVGGNLLWVAGSRCVVQVGAAMRTGLAFETSLTHFNCVLTPASERRFGGRGLEPKKLPK